MNSENKRSTANFREPIHNELPYSRSISRASPEHNNKMYYDDDDDLSGEKPEHFETLSDDEFDENRLSSSKPYDTFGRKSSYNYETVQTKQSPLSSNREQFQTENFSPFKGEQGLSTLTMEKIANLKEFSKDMFIMEDDHNDENPSPSQLNKNHLSNIEEENFTSKNSDYSTYRSTNKNLMKTDENEMRDLSSAKPLKPIQTESDISTFTKRGSRTSQRLSEAIKPFDERLLTKNFDEHIKTTEVSDTFRSADLQQAKFIFEKTDMVRKPNDLDLAPNLNVSFTLGKNPKVSSLENHEDRAGFKLNTSPPREREDRSIKLNSPELLFEVKSATSPQGSPGDDEDREYDEYSTQRSKDIKIRSLIEINMQLKNKLARQEQHLLQYNDAMDTIETLRNELTQLQSKHLQNEIAYKSQINILKENNKKFVPSVVSPEIQAILSDKDRSIQDLNKTIEHLGYEKERLEEQLKENLKVLSARIRQDELAELHQGADASRSFIEDQQEKSSSFIQANKPPVPAAKDITSMKALLASLSTPKICMILGLSTYIKEMKQNTLQRRQQEILRIVDEVVELVEKNIQKEGNLTQRSSDLVDNILQLAVNISQAAHNHDWQNTEALIYELEKLTMKEFAGIESLQKVFNGTGSGKNRNTTTMLKSHAKRRTASQMNISTQQQQQLEKPKSVEIYGSDYSDEEFEMESFEEKAALDMVLEIKETLDDRKIDENKIRSIWYEVHGVYLQDKPDAPIDEVCNFLSQLGVGFDIDKYQALFLRSDYLDQKTGMINLLKFASLVRLKDKLWWKTKLHNNSFDLKYKNFNLAPLLKPENSLRVLILENIHNKMAQYIRGGAEIDAILNQDKNKLFEAGFITKKNLRKKFINHQLPFTKLETQLISLLLDSTKKNKILFEDLSSFLQDGDLTPFYNYYLAGGGQNDQAQQPENSNEDFREILIHLRANIDFRDPALVKEIKDVFSLNDTRFSGLMTHQQFYNCCVECNLPFSSVEDIDLVFDYFVRTTKTKQVNQSSQPVIQYSRFLDLLFNESLIENQPLTGGGDVTTASFIKGGDSRSQFLEKENELQAAYQRIEELENKLQEYDFNNKGHPSILQDLSPALANKENVQVNSQNNSFYSSKRPTKPNVSTMERTLQMKVEDLEYENAKLRKTLDEEKSARAYENESQKQMFQTILDQTNQSREDGENRQPMRNLENKLNNIEQGYVLKEMELKSEIDRMSKTKASEIQVLKKKFQLEKESFQKIIQNKDKEINSYRQELEGVLGEMDSLRKKSTRRF